MAKKTYNRMSQDVGNIIGLEHVNITVSDQSLATRFYISGLGFTRDPYNSVGVENMWVNVGQQQFHLPTRPSQVIPGHIGVVVPDLEALRSRLSAVQGPLSGTAFSYEEEDGYVAVTCPWGNRFRCYGADSGGEELPLGIRYVEFLVKPGSAAGIGEFYQEVIGAPAAFVEEAGGPAARVGVGCDQELVFRETSEEIPPYDGHHIAVYLANFSGPYAFLKKHRLITEESSAFQYRFQNIVDPQRGGTLALLEHEVRSLHHPMYHRSLVNRNTAQVLAGYGRGRDAFSA